MLTFCQLVCTSWFLRIQIVRSLLPATKLKLGLMQLIRSKLLDLVIYLQYIQIPKIWRKWPSKLPFMKASIVLSCATTLELGLTQPCENLDFIPSCTRLISSKADHPDKNRSQMKHSQTKCSNKEQSYSVLPAHGHQVNQCVLQDDKVKPRMWEYQGHVNSMYGKNCLSTLCFDKNCQDTNMQPLEASKEIKLYAVSDKSSNMQSVESEILQSSSKKRNAVKQESVCDDKNCQSIKYMGHERTGNLPSLIICSQLLNQVICGQSDQQHSLLTRSLIQYLFNLSRSISLKNVKLDQSMCVITRTVRLPMCAYADTSNAII